jgi:hypothetical protein
MKYFLALFFCLPLLAKDAPKEYDLALTVLQAKSATFTHGANNSSQTNCQINGNNIDCGTHDTSFQGFRGLSYLMLATSSDGNTYMFGCDAAWRWSHCAGLRVGTTFRARFDNGRLAVIAKFGTPEKFKEKEIKYQVFQSEITKQ